MDENLTRAIARLVDRGFDLDSLTPDGIAVVRRGDELVELHIEDGRVMMRGDIPPDLPRTSITTMSPAGLDRTALDPSVESAAVTAPGMAADDERDRRTGRGGRRSRRRWLLALLLLLLLLALAAPLILDALDRSLPDLWPAASATPMAAVSPGARRSRDFALPRRSVYRRRSPPGAGFRDSGRPERGNRITPRAFATIGRPRGHVAKW